MAIAPKDEIAAEKIDTTDPAYPQGKAQNITTPGDATGTPLIKVWLNDLWGFLQALLATAGITPSGTPDTSLVSQYMDSIQSLWRRTYATLASAVASTRIKEGNLVHIEDRGGVWEVVLTSSVTPNGYDIVVSTGVPTLSFKLVIDNTTTMQNFGVTGTNDSGAFSRALSVGVGLSNGNVNIEAPVSPTLTKNTILRVNGTLDASYVSSTDAVSISADTYDLSVIINNAVSSGPITGDLLSISGGKNVIVTDCSCDNTVLNFVKVLGAAKTSITNNNLVGVDPETLGDKTTGGNAIDIKNLSNVSVSHNTIFGFTTHIDNTSTENDVTDVKIESNVCRNSGDTSIFVRAINNTGGVTPTTTKNVVISNNTVENSGKAAIKIEIPNGDECHIINSSVVGNVVRGWGKYLGSGGLHYVNAVPENNATIEGIISVGNVVDGTFTDGTPTVAAESRGHDVNGITDIKLDDIVRNTFSPGAVFFASSDIKNSSKYTNCNNDVNFSSDGCIMVTSSADYVDSSKVFGTVWGSGVVLNKARRYKLTGEYCDTVAGYGIKEDGAGAGGAKTVNGCYQGCQLYNNTLGAIFYAVTDLPRSSEFGCMDDLGTRHGGDETRRNDLGFTNDSNVGYYFRNSTTGKMNFWNGSGWELADGTAA